MSVRQQSRLSLIYPFNCLFSQGSWEKKLIERVHNVRSTSARKRLPDDVPASKSKRGRPKTTSQKRYPILGIPGNDEASDGRNVRELDKEMKREHPRKDNVISLMRQTFHLRREDVVKEADDVSVASITETHPVLTLPYAVSDLMFVFSRNTCISAWTCCTCIPCVFYMSYI